MGQPQWKQARTGLRPHTAQPQFGRKMILETSEKRPHQLGAITSHRFVMMSSQTFIGSILASGYRFVQVFTSLFRGT